MKKTIIYIALLAIVGTVLFYSCGKGYSSSTATYTPPATTPTPVTAGTVNIAGFAFSPDTIRLKAGGTVTWTNSDSAPHTVTDVAGSFDSGSIAPGGSFERTFATAGTTTYHCTIHSMMKSAVVVVTN